MAELDCGHNQHVRHKPPMQWREWVLDADSRAARVGSPLACPLCDRAELPDPLRLARRAQWDHSTMPAALHRDHRVEAGTWIRIVAEAGQLRVRAATTPVLDVVLEAGSAQAIPPGVEHRIEPQGTARLAIEFLIVDRTGPGAEAGGDPACWAPLICPECGGVAGDGRGHHPGCATESEMKN